MYAVGWAEAEQHDETFLELDVEKLQLIADEVWRDLQRDCNMPRAANIEVFTDVTQRGVLAFTRRTLMLVDNTWKSSMSQNFYGTDIEVHFNPNVPNGWYDGTNCDTGWRYDLRTVMRHELLHGAGLSSSIRHSASQTSVGYTSLGQCYPTFYDTRLESEGVPLVDGCTYNVPAGTVYMAGRKVFVPDEFRSGSSYSHHDEEGLFRWQLAPRECHEFGMAEYDMLEGLEYNCSHGKMFLSAGQKLNANLWLSSCTFAVLTMTAGLSRSIFLSCLLSSVMASVACCTLHCM